MRGLGCAQGPLYLLYLISIAMVASALTHNAAWEPGALPALAAAVAASGAAATPQERLAAENSASVLALVANAGPGLAQRVGEVPGALPALVSAVAAGGIAGEHSTLALRFIAATDPGLAQLARGRGAGGAGGAGRCCGARRQCGRHGRARGGCDQVLGGDRNGSGRQWVRPLRGRSQQRHMQAHAGVRGLQLSTLLQRRVPAPRLGQPQGGVLSRHRHPRQQRGCLSCAVPFSWCTACLLICCRSQLVLARFALLIPGSSPALLEME